LFKPHSAQEAALDVDARITIDDSGKLLYSPNIAHHWKPQL
jgi:hypothetical protein